METRDAEKAEKKFPASPAYAIVKVNANGDSWNGLRSDEKFRPHWPEKVLRHVLAVAHYAKLAEAYTQETGIDDGGPWNLAPGRIFYGEHPKTSAIPAIASSANMLEAANLLVESVRRLSRQGLDDGKILQAALEEAHGKTGFKDRDDFARRMGKALPPNLDAKTRERLLQSIEWVSYDFSRQE